VSVAIQDTTTGQYWSGTGFTQSSATYVPVTSGASSWSLSLAAANLTTGHSYTVTAQATDSYANSGTSPSATFSYNTSAPTLTLTSSGPNVYASGTTVLFKQGGSGSFTISASDPLGISSTKFPAAPSGWTKTIGTNSATYRLTTAKSSTTLKNVIATDTAGNSVSENIAINLDSGIKVTGVTLANGGVANIPGTNDAVTITFSEPLNATTLCSSWTDGSLQSLTNATVTWSDNGSNDTFTTASTSCSGGGAFGKVSSGANYIPAGGSAAFTNSTVTWNPSNKTLIIKLGTLVSGSVQSAAAGKPGYTPNSGIIDVVGNSLSTSTFTSLTVSGF
jgi:hypothetical protein